MLHVPTVIVDDDPESAGLIQAIMRKLSLPTNEFLVYTNPLQALYEVNWNFNQIIFLDVEMPEMTGLELLDMIPAEHGPVIMVTGYEKYAIASIKRNVSSYLLKPLREDDLRESSWKAFNHINRQSRENLATKISIPTTNGFRVLNTANLSRLVSESNYTTVYYNQERILVAKTLKTFEDSLDGRQFVRINQRNLINVELIDSFDRATGGTVKLTTGESLLLGRTYRSAFLKRFSNFRS